MSNYNHQFEATYLLGKELGSMAERARVIEILKALPAEFHHQDHVTRAVAKAIKEIQNEDKD